MGMSLPLLLTIKRREKSTIPSKGLLVIGLQYIAFHSIKVSVVGLCVTLYCHSHDHSSYADTCYDGGSLAAPQTPHGVGSVQPQVPL